VFDHVMIRASDRAASERFYETVLRTLGIEKSHSTEHFVEWDDFSLLAAESPDRVTRRLHIAFAAPSHAHVDEFWRVGTEAGYRDDGAPGRRPQYRDDYYGAFLLDPDGNSAEAVHHGELRADGIVDHLWFRTRDPAPQAEFYELLGRHAGIRRNEENTERVQFVQVTGSFSFVPGDPTENVHLAFPAADDATVDAFHRELTQAGYRDNGPPGERPQYHAGYYGAFVLDPDGHNVELVNHNR
jgi:catechol 2,3-dioxygenase-like lactoylglutathione lyase family enzyme